MDWSVRGTRRSVSQEGHDFVAAGQLDTLKVNTLNLAYFTLSWRIKVNIHVGV